jgi:hypothetical protein
VPDLGSVREVEVQEVALAVLGNELDHDLGEVAVRVEGKTSPHPVSTPGRAA